MTLGQALTSYRLRLVALLPLLAAIYYLIVPDMVMDWYRDENYSHGFLVPFISGYFLWQRWPALKDRPIRPAGAGLLVIVLGLIQLVVGWLGTEYFTMRSSLIVILAGCVLFWFGWEILKAMALPIGFLIFMVPIPYLIYDMVAFPLKMFVTRVSVAFLHLSGVVVLREGNIIMFPATTLEVADACSGIRSLVSLLALAVAYAFFVQTTAWRRFFIVLSAVPIAIATNALRVIGTGFLAQWWGAKAAQGFFHEFAGLMVFLLAILLLLGMGVLLKTKSDQGQPAGAEREMAAASGPAAAGVPAFRFAVPYLLMAGAALYLNLHQDHAVPINRPFSQFPRQMAGWTMCNETEFSASVLEVLKPTDYLARQYRGPDGRLVNLYVGFHNGGKGMGGIHSPKHCLPGNGWQEVSTRQGQLTTERGSRDVVCAVYQKGDSRELFLYWFQMMGHAITDEYSLKLSEIKHSLLYNRRDETFIRISVPFEEDEARAKAAAEAFARDLERVLVEFLPG